MPRRIGSGHWPAGLVLSLQRLRITQRRGRCGAALAGRFPAMPRQARRGRPDVRPRETSPVTSPFAAKLYRAGPRTPVARHDQPRWSRERTRVCVPVASSRSSEIQIEPEAPRMGARPIATPPPASRAEPLAPRRPRDPPFPHGVMSGLAAGCFCMCGLRAAKLLPREGGDLRPRGTALSPGAPAFAEERKPKPCLPARSGNS